MADVFDEIHKMLHKARNNSGYYDEILSLLLGSACDDVRAPYREDMNHAWYIIGDIYYTLKAFEKAKIAFLKSIDYWSEDIDALMALANTYVELDEPYEAKKHLLKALELNPDSDKILYNLGNAYFDLEEYKNAIKYYSKVNNYPLKTQAETNSKIAESKRKKQ